MFDIGFFEIIFIAVVALLVLGPEKMPHAVRMCAAYWGRLKRSFIATKTELEEQLAIQDIKQQLQQEQAKIRQLIEQQDIEQQDIEQQGKPENNINKQAETPPPTSQSLTSISQDQPPK